MCVLPPVLHCRDTYIIMYMCVVITDAVEGRNVQRESSSSTIVCLEHGRRNINVYRIDTACKQILRVQLAPSLTDTEISLNKNGV